MGNTFSCVATPENSLDMEILGWNPLLNPSNLETILDYLDIKDLKVCRLVCKTWCAEGTKYLRDRSTVHITDWREIKVYTSGIVPLRHDTCNTSIANGTNVYLEDFWLLHNLSFRGEMEQRDKEIVECLKKFLNKFGRHIKTLQITVGNHPLQIHQFENFNHNLPNVQKLIVNLHSGLYGHPLLEMPSVTELEVTKWYKLRISDECFDRIYRALPNLRKVKGLDLEYLISPSSLSPKLLELEKPVNLSDDDFKKLTAKGFPLRKLKVTTSKDFDSLNPNISVDFLAFLESVGDSLVELYVMSNIPFQHPGNWYRNPLINLKVLTIDSCISSLDFLLEFPNLKILVAKCLGSAGPNTFALEHIHNLESLDIDCPYSLSSQCIDKSLRILCDYYGGWSFNRFDELLIELQNLEPCNSWLSVYCVRNMARTFPNLKVLKLSHLADEEIGVIEKFLDLEELVLKAGRFTDSGIIDLLENIKMSASPDQFNKCGRDFISVGLKALTKMELHSEKLTDSCFQRLLECKQLKKLAIVGSTVSPDFVEAFVSQPELFHLEVYLPPQPWSTPILTAPQAKRILDKMRGRTLILSECLAPSRDLTIDKIKTYLLVIRNKQEDFTSIRWQNAILAYLPYTVAAARMADQKDASRWRRFRKEWRSCVTGEE